MYKVKKITKEIIFLTLLLVNISLAKENLTAFGNTNNKDNSNISQPVFNSDASSNKGEDEVEDKNSNKQLKSLLEENLVHLSYRGVTNKIHSLKEVKELYTEVGNKLLWSNEAKLTKTGFLLIQEILKAPEHALLSEIYHSEALSGLTYEEKIYDETVFDIVMTDAFITYKKHLTNGILNPKVLISSWNTEPREINFFSLYNQIKATQNVTDYFTNDEDYNILKKEYKYYSELKEDTDFQYLSNVKLKKGSKGSAVTILREKLGLDTSSNIFDENVKQALKDYQASKGLYADGILGKNTRRSLNESPTDILEKIAINLERYRWGYIPQETNYIWVNIPAYKMAVKNGNANIFESDVIVGRNKRRTPIFSDTLEYIVLSPYWNVPRTIFNKDKVPVLRKNPNAFGSSLKAINTSTGKVISASSVDWSTNKSNYRLRQNPGPENPLGRMKFLFPNKHAIYLHDTPTRKLFERDNRAYSSGCIRVKRAEDLAVFLLDKMGWEKEKIITKSERRKETWVNLETNLNYPVFLVYHTAWVDSNKSVIFASDIYKQDEIMKKTYQKKLISYIK